MEGDIITMQDIFAIDTRNSADRVRTDLRPTGIRPALTDRLAGRGIQLPSAWFGYAEPSEIGA
jgi:hypothetical protein